MSDDDEPTIRRPARPPVRRRRSRATRRKLKLPKSSILFFVGLALTINEAVLRGDQAPRVALLVTYLLMMGFPVAEIADIFRNWITDSWEEQSDEADDERKPKP